MGRIPREVVDAVRDRTDIVEVVKRHVTLTRRGGNFVGLCPFHQEKTPSFNVIPGKGIYHCFGCQAGGDVFKFLMQLEGLSFVESIKELAGPAGVTIEERELTPAERKDLQKRGADKAAERKVQRHTHIAELRAQLKILESGLADLEVRNSAAHAERATAIAAMDEKVVKLFDAKIAALQATGVATPPAPAGAAPPGTQLAVMPLPDADAAEQASLKELEAARQRAAAAIAKAQQCAASVAGQFEKTFELDPTVLPKTNTPQHQR